MQRLPDVMNTAVLDMALDTLFTEEGRKMARAMPPRRVRRFLAMLDEFEQRHGTVTLKEYYKRTFFEGLIDEAMNTPRKRG